MSDMALANLLPGHPYQDQSGPANQELFHRGTKKRPLNLDHVRAQGQQHKLI